MCQVKPKTAGSSTRSIRRSALSPLLQAIWAVPPGRRLIVAELPNQVPRPSAVVSAAHTAAGGRAISTVRSMRSGNPMPASSVATRWLLLTLWQPVSCVKRGGELVEPNRGLAGVLDQSPNRGHRSGARSRIGPAYHGARRGLSSQDSAGVADHPAT